jgi:hypothetical protein
MEPMLPAGCKTVEGLPRVEVVEMRWWRLLTVPLAATLVVVGGCAVGGDRDPVDDGGSRIVNLLAADLHE